MTWVSNDQFAKPDTVAILLSVSVRCPTVDYTYFAISRLRSVASVVCRWFIAECFRKLLMLDDTEPLGYAISRSYSRMA